MKVVIAGAGTYGQVYLHYLQQDSDFEVVGFLDDDPAKRGTEVLGIPVLGNTHDFTPLAELGVDGIFAPIGNNHARVDILSRASAQGLATPSFIHPTAIVPSNTTIGNAVYILAGTILMPYIELRDFVMVSTGVKLNHHSVIGTGSFLSSGSCIGAGIRFEKRVFAGIGCTIMTGVKTIGAHATIGAGAVIIRDVPAHATVVGNPGRVIKTADKKPDMV